MTRQAERSIVPVNEHVSTNRNFSKLTLPAHVPFNVGSLAERTVLVARVALIPIQKK